MGGRTIGGGIAGVAGAARDPLAAGDAGPGAASTTVRIHSVTTFGTVDGPGIRYVVFFQGCPLRCRYCHNRDMWGRRGGREWRVLDLAADIERYAPYLRPAGGGVTAGGGEPLLQAAGITELFSLAHRLGLTTALDTSGHSTVSPPVESLLDECDLVLLDIKQMDDARHRELTGVSNRLTLEFARGVARRRIPLRLRYVVLPGYTTDPADIAAFGEFAASLSGVEQIELLPYHAMGRYKWEAVGARYALHDVDPPTAEEMHRIREQLAPFSVPVRMPEVR